MKIKIKYFILIVITCIIAGLITGKRISDNHTNTPDQYTSDTTFIYDTIYKQIPVDVHHYHEVVTELNQDTLYIPVDVDTLEILSDYFKTFQYERSWNDSIIEVNLVDVVSQNKIQRSNWLEYKLLQPQTVVTNVNKYTNYSKYLGVGLNTDLKLEAYSFNVTYVTPKFNYNILYYPKQEAWGFGITYNFLKFK